MTVKFDVHPNYEIGVPFEDRRLKLDTYIGKDGWITLLVKDHHDMVMAEVTLFTQDQAYCERLAALIKMAGVSPVALDHGELHIDQLVQSMEAVGITAVVVDDDTPPPAA